MLCSVDPKVDLLLIISRIRVEVHKTTSKNPIVRLFYFLLAVSLYNVWQLANLIIPEINNLKTKYESQSRIFGTLLKGCLRMLGKGPPYNIYQSQSLDRRQSFLSI